MYIRSYVFTHVYTYKYTKNRSPTQNLMLMCSAKIFTFASGPLQFDYHLFSLTRHHKFVLKTLEHLAIIKLHIPSCQAPCNSGDIRLHGGYNYGRVEVCVLETWSTICSDADWDNTDASVICRQLGFSPFGKLLD